MAGGFLHRLLGGSTPLPSEVQGALAELDQVEKESPARSAAVGLLRDLLGVLFREGGQDILFSLSASEVASLLAGGMPLLRGRSLPLDFRTLERRWQEIGGIVGKRQEEGRALVDAVRRGRLDLETLTREALAGHPDVVHVQADAAGLDAGLAATVLRWVLFPSLVKISADLAPLRDGVSWPHGYCPVCGSWPLLGEYRGLEQLRWLRCGLCAAGWEFPRLRCPFCGTDDHQQLGYFHVEGEEARLRAATCDACRGYVKMVNTLTALTAPQLLVADLATLHLDLAAAARGYFLP